MIELLERAAADPGRPAVVTHEEQVTYGDLHARASRVAAALSARGISRFAVLDHDAADVLALLGAASAVGAEACLYPPAEAAELVALLGRFDHKVLVSAEDVAADPAVRQAAEVLAPADLGLDAGGLDTPSPGGSDYSTNLGAPGGSGYSTNLGAPGGSGYSTDLDQGRRVAGEERAGVSRRPHLVLTTGTTGEPKGVRHDWDRLLRGVRRVKPAPDERWLLAYGLHQFAGLQILLHVMAAGATLVAPAPRRPREGLRAMRELGVTHASATPTYWRFLLAELTGDGGPVPALRQVTLGGEAIPSPVLDQLRATFPDASVSQIYAASEFGSTGSMKDGRAGLSVSASSPRSSADTDLKVVDGELWARSRTGMLGYYGEPPIEDPDGWRPTGDLVEVVDDRVVFKGRASEVINVGGVKVHPLPIEERIGAVPGVAVARVWGRPNPMTGAIVAVDLVLTDDADPDRTKMAVREACLDLPGAAQPRSIRIVDDISTKGSKIVRQA